ncbi:hypothetical protein LXL04_008333 [Taraxacum kok-saghyz]
MWKFRQSCNHRAYDESLKQRETKKITEHRRMTYYGNIVSFRVGIWSFDLGQCEDLVRVISERKAKLTAESMQVSQGSVDISEKMMYLLNECSRIVVELNQKTTASGGGGTGFGCGGARGDNPPQFLDDSFHWSINQSDHGMNVKARKKERKAIYAFYMGDTPFTPFAPWGDPITPLAPKRELFTPLEGPMTPPEVQ